MDLDPDDQPGSETRIRNYALHLCHENAMNAFYGQIRVYTPHKKNISSDSTQRERSAYILNEPTFNILCVQEVVTLLKKYLIYVLAS